MTNDRMWLSCKAGLCWPMCALRTYAMLSAGVRAIVGGGLFCNRGAAFRVS